MKPLKSLTNVERAKLLHNLFPDEIPALLKFVTGMSLTINEHREQERETWGNQLFGFDFWLSLSREAEERIKRYGSKMEKRSTLFAGQLFDGYNALYLVHCLIQYVTIRKHTNGKFSAAVDLFFNA